MADDAKWLDLGCGPNKRAGCIGMDCLAIPGVDVCASLEGTLPFADDRFDRVYSAHSLEHTSNPAFVMEEIHRVLRPGGTLFLSVPHFTNNRAYDPFHKSYFSLAGFEVYDPSTRKGSRWSFMTSARFRIRRRDIVVKSSPKLPWTLALAWVARRRPLAFEELLTYWAPVDEIRLEMEAIK